jgi:hypothetical protein
VDAGLILNYRTGLIGVGVFAHFYYLPDSLLKVGRSQCHVSCQASRESHPTVTVASISEPAITPITRLAGRVLSKSFVVISW